jgi:CheY-like chemotaxis protein
MSRDRGARILLAEDSNLAARIAEAALVEAGYEVLRACDGEQCMTMVRAESPDVLVLDLMMPKIHGLDVLGALKTDPQTADIGVIICSAKDFKTEMDQARDLGAIAFLPKPLDRQQLIEEIEAFLAQRQPRPAATAAIDATELYEPRIPASTLALRLWGTRGSIPTSGPDYARHGGNTTCMEAVHGDEYVLLDAGSGIRGAGERLLAGGPRRVHLFITHTHWDHIQGFPFFKPAYVPGFEIVIHAAHNVEWDMEGIFRGQLDRAYFPVQMEDMQAELTFVDLPDEAVQIGDMKITWEYALHPGSAVGYRIDVGERGVVFIPDNECLKGYLGDPAATERDDEHLSSHGEQLQLMEGAELLIHEAQYTQAEYAKKIGWGHSSVGNACALVRQSDVKRWIVTHHDPDHDDAMLQDKLNITRQILRDLDSAVAVDHAYDGMVEFL